MKSKSLIKSTTPGFVIMALIVMIACQLDIQEIRNVRKLDYPIEIVSKIGGADSVLPAFYYFTFFQNNIDHQLITSPLYVHVLAYHDQINFQAFKRQKQIDLSTDTNKSLLFYYSHLHYNTEYPEIIT
ncbi:MAG: hypothetical protein PF572_04240 [Patescibacteria group bacterium]|jgi:glycerol-3-phosphate O-acyltransferase|nr:hypothetical protein [Patescibacteria group bacterium]